MWRFSLLDYCGIDKGLEPIFYHKLIHINKLPVLRHIVIVRFMSILPLCVGRLSRP